MRWRHPASEARPTRRAWLALLGLAVLARPAWAHAILRHSDPRHEARVPAGERVLSFRFNSRIDRARSRLTLIRPDRAQAVLALLPGPEDELSARAVLAPGRHVVRWQVLAVDGHITRGDVPFTVVAAA